MGKVGDRKDSPRKSACWGKGEGERGGVRETFSLFVTLELGAEEKPTMEAIKREEGGGEQKEHWPSAQSITASLAAGRWLCLVARC